MWKGKSVTVLTYFRSLQHGILCFILRKEIQSSGESPIKERTVRPFYFSVSIFLDLSYPLELLQVRQVVDYVIQQLQLTANIFTPVLSFFFPFPAIHIIEDQ